MARFRDGPGHAILPSVKLTLYPKPQEKSDVESLDTATVPI